MQAHSRDTRIIYQRRGNLRLRGLGHVATGHHIGNRQAALLHGQVDSNVRALRQDSHAAFNPLAAVLIGPQQGPVQCIDKAIAIGPQNGHLPRRSNQLRLQAAAAFIFSRSLGKTRGKTHRSARAHRGQCSDQFNGGVAIDPDEHRIRRARQVRERFVGQTAGDFSRLGVDRPDLPGKAHVVRLFDDLLTPGATTNDGDGFGLKQAAQVTGCGRSSGCIHNHSVWCRGSVNMAQITIRLDHVAQARF